MRLHGLLLCISANEERDVRPLLLLVGYFVVFLCVSRHSFSWVASVCTYTRPFLSPTYTKPLLHAVPCSSSLDRPPFPLHREIKYTSAKSYPRLGAYTPTPLPPSPRAFQSPCCSSITSIWSSSSSSRDATVAEGLTRSPSNKKRRESTLTPLRCAKV